MKYIEKFIEPYFGNPGQVNEEEKSLIVFEKTY
jgi:hypothetical protein